MRRIAIALLALATIGAGQSPQDAPERSTGPLDKMICKKFPRTEALVASYRACKTKREWDIERDASKMYSVSDGCALRYNGENCALP